MGIHADLYPQPWLNCCLLLSCKKCSLCRDPCLNVYVYHGCPLSTQNIERKKKTVLSAVITRTECPPDCPSCRRNLPGTTAVRYAEHRKLLLTQLR